MILRPLCTNYFLSTDLIPVGHLISYSLFRVTILSALDILDTSKDSTKVTIQQGQY